MDEQYLLPTPENVPISYELAGIGSRFAAALLNLLIVTAIDLGILAIVLLALGPLDTNLYSEVWVMAVGWLLILAITASYDLIFEIVWNGQSPGKRAVGIRVVRDDGTPITALAAVLRNVLRLVDMLPMYYIIGIIVMLIDGKVRRLGDLAAGTIVVKERRDVAVDQLTLAAVELPREQTGTPLVDVGALSQDDHRLVKEYLLRRHEMRPDAQQALARRIAEVIAAKLGRALGEQEPEDFLVEIGRSSEQSSYERRDS